LFEFGILGVYMGSTAEDNQRCCYRGVSTMVMRSWCYVFKGFDWLNGFLEWFMVNDRR